MIFLHAIVRSWPRTGGPGPLLLTETAGSALSSSDRGAANYQTVLNFLALVGLGAVVLLLFQDWL